MPIDSRALSRAPMQIGLETAVVGQRAIVGQLEVDTFNPLEGRPRFL
jgi:hypothetical protein